MLPMAFRARSRELAAFFHEVRACPICCLRTGRLLFRCSAKATGRANLRVVPAGGAVSAPSDRRSRAAASRADGLVDSRGDPDWPHLRQIELFSSTETKGSCSE